VRIELTRPGFTARCSDRLSYGHHQKTKRMTGFEPVSMSFADPRLAIRPHPQNLQARRTGIEPVASRFGGGRSTIGTSDASQLFPPSPDNPGEGRGGGLLRPMAAMRREGFEPPCISMRGRGYGPVHYRSATYAISQRGRIRTFDLVRPRHARCQASLHAEKCSRRESNPHSPVEGRLSSPLDDESKAPTDGFEPPPWRLTAARSTG
jgi:hypothetical protein